MSIGIREGSSRDMLAVGAEIAGAESADVFAAVGELAGQVSVLTRDKLTPLVTLLSQRVDSITGTLDAASPELLARAQTLLERLNSASARSKRSQAAEPTPPSPASSAMCGDSARLRETRKLLDMTVGSLADIAARIAATCKMQPPTSPPSWPACRAAWKSSPTISNRQRNLDELSPGSPGSG